MVLAAVLGGGSARAAEKKIVLVAGRMSHGPGGHEFNAGVLLLKSCLDKVDGLKVTTYTNGWPKDPNAFDGADAIVLYMDGGDGHPAIQDGHLAQLDAALKHGAGLACLHYAVEVPKDKGGAEWLKWTGGYFETFWSVNPTWEAEFKQLPQHPITRGVKPFTIYDEWYYHMRFQDSHVTPILSAVPPDSTRDHPDDAHGGNQYVRARKGMAEDLAWAYEREDGGRGFGFTGAHYHKNWGDDNFRKLVLNAIVWVAKGDVPPDGIASSVTPEQLEQNLDPKVKRPNILFIMSDDHAYQAISAYGDKRQLLQTPNLDRIGKEGMRFNRCLVVNSICGPARAACLTGTYNHINGFYNNSNCKFDGSQITYPKLMQAAGYQTAMIGKWHLMSDPTGFDFWDILPGQGVYYNPPMIRNGERIKPEGYVTEIITDAAIDWLKSRDQAKPFLLCVQHKAPHREWYPNVKDLDFDHDRTYQPPDTLFDDYANRGIAEHDQAMMVSKALDDVDMKLAPLPKYFNAAQAAQWNAYYQPRNQAFTNAHLTGDKLVLWKYNRYMHDYLGCIKSVDDNVGRLLKYLDDTGLASNTIVVYTSDQGFFLGEHGWFDKRWIFEESLRAPLLIRWPGVIKPGGVNSDIVSDIDFAETFLDAAGLIIPDRMQGRSMMPALKDHTPADWRKSFYYHYYEYPAPHHVRPHYGVVTDRYKLVHFYYDADYWELFDLQKDPQEMRSVFGNPEYAAEQKSLEAELAKLRVELKDTNADTAFARGDGGTNYYFIGGEMKERPQPLKRGTNFIR